MTYLHNFKDIYHFFACIKRGGIPKTFLLSQYKSIESLLTHTLLCSSAQYHLCGIKNVDDIGFLKKNALISRVFSQDTGTHL